MNITRTEITKEQYEQLLRFYDKTEKERESERIVELEKIYGVK